jgi:hypothetical protein
MVFMTDDTCGVGLRELLIEEIVWCRPDLVILNITLLLRELSTNCSMCIVTNTRNVRFSVVEASFPGCGIDSVSRIL